MSKPWENDGVTLGAGALVWILQPDRTNGVVLCDYGKVIFYDGSAQGPVKVKSINHGVVACRPAQLTVVSKLALANMRAINISFVLQLEAL